MRLINFVSLIVLLASNHAIAQSHYDPYRGLPPLVAPAIVAAPVYNSGHTYNGGYYQQSNYGNTSFISAPTYNHDGAYAGQRNVMCTTFGNMVSCF